MKEKLARHTRLFAIQHLKSDVELLRKLNPSSELLKKTSGDIRYASEVLKALLDVATDAEIIAFRRNESRLVKDNVILFIEKYNAFSDSFGKDTVFETVEQVETLIDTLDISCDHPDCEDISSIVGFKLSDLNFPYDNASEIHYVSISTDALVRRMATDMEAQRVALEEKEAELEAQRVALEEKEAELLEKEVALEEKEAELEENTDNNNVSELAEEKEAELLEKEAALEEKEAEDTDQKKSVKNKNTPK